MRFHPHAPGAVQSMLEVVGAASIDELFSQIPEAIRQSAGVDLPRGLGEAEVVRRMSALAEANQRPASFQGAGAYHHYVPAVVRHIMARSEFATAYTPYQPEVSQGTLAACFEFQTYVARLAGLDVANASLYDGASAFAEALLMALRVGRKRSRLLVSAGVHPEYVEVARTYLAGTGDVEIQMVPLAADGRTDLAALQAALGDDVAAVALGYPNVFGVIDDVAGAARLAEAAGAMTVSVTTEALALALLRAPGHLGADIMVAEGQSLGLPPAFGGPGVGLFAARRHHVRQMPGRLVGETVDSEGRRGYVLTLSTREQHIRREKATSNICTNQGLTALCVTVYLSLAGARGLRALAVANTRRAHAVAARLEREAGLAPAMSGPFFNEFVVRVPDLDARFEAALDAGVVAGVRLSRLFAQRADLADALLVTVTEVGEEADVDVLVQALAGRKAA